MLCSSCTVSTWADLAAILVGDSSVGSEDGSVIYEEINITSLMIDINALVCISLAYLQLDSG